LSNHPGVTYHVDDKDLGPFTLRISGTSAEFVSFIHTYDGFVDTAIGWERQFALKFNTLEGALAAADQVWLIEGYYTTVEPS